MLIVALLLPMGCNSDKSAKASAGDEHEEHAQGETRHEEGEEGVRLSPEQVRTAELELVKVENKAIGKELEVLGAIASDTDRTVQIRPEAAGTVQEVLVAVGDPVKKGELLIRYLAEASPPQPKELKADRSGIIVGLYAEPGGAVVPAVPLATLADTSKLRCGLDVYEKDIGPIRKGQKVRLHVAAFPDESFGGRITYISPRVDENSRTVKVRVDVDNPRGNLKFGMFVRGYIQVGQRRGLAVPKAAIQRIGGSPTVFVAEGRGAFVPRKVTVGDESGNHIEIKAGLKAGETVVARGSFILKSELGKESLEAGHGH